MTSFPHHPMTARAGRVLLLFLLLVSVFTTYAEEPEPRSSLTVVLDDNYPPYVFRDINGKLQGILPDEWALWQKKTGVEVDLKGMNWGDAQQFMQDGHADVIDTIFRTEGREKYYDFTPPYEQIDVPVFAHKSLSGVTNVSALRGLTLGVKTGDAVVGHLNNRGFHDLKQYPSYEAIIQAVIAQEIKAFSIDQPAAMYFLYKHGLADEYEKSFVIYTGEFHRAVWKNQPELLSLVQKGFNKISAGEYRAIDQKWLGSPLYWYTILRKWLPACLVLAGLILLLVVGNFILRMRIRSNTRELRSALSSLQKSQDRIQRILKLAPVGIGVVQHRKIRQANDTLCRMTGYSQEELIDRSTRMLYPTQDEYDRVGKIFYKQIARDGISSLEFQGQTQAGESRCWALNGTLADPSKKDGAVIFTQMDVTERKQAEEQLRISSNYFVNIFNSINEALFIHDAETGKLLDVNQRVCEMYGYSTREAALAESSQLRFAGEPPFSVEDAGQWIQKTRSEGPQVFEWLGRHRDGHTFWLEANTRQVRFGANERIVVSMRDISDRKKTEEERLNLERRVQEAQKLESLGLLAGGIAHDFNNLLAAIMGNIDLALLEIPDQSPAYNDIQSAIVATKRAADLVQQMLAYAGKGQFRIEPVDVSTTIQETAQMLQSSISKTAELSFQLPDTLPTIHADVTQFRQVIMNLVINASEALEGREGSLTLSAGLQDIEELSSPDVWPHEPLKPGPYVYIQASDTGVGIHPEVMDKIFDPFFSTKFTGRGLGLAAVLGIVRSHKGAVHVDSVLGKGTTIRVLFPASPKTAAAEGVHGIPPAAGAGRLVLLVEDEPSLLETGAKLLDRLGYRVVCATTGEHAIQLFHAQANDLSGVILDLTMPNLDGAQTLAQLRRIRPDIPVLVSSGHSEQEVLRRFVGLELNGFISKPYSLDGLRKALGASLPA